MRSIALVVVVAALVVAAPACRPDPAVAELHRLVHHTSLSRFVGWWEHEQGRANRVPVATVRRWLDTAPHRLDNEAARRGRWDLSTDLCSFAPDTTAVFDFRRACIRHDWAWRNLRRLQARIGGAIDTRARRLSASDRFLDDMQMDCARRTVFVRSSCRSFASAYHRAVRVIS